MSPRPMSRPGFGPLRPFTHVFRIEFHAVGKFLWNRIIARALDDSTTYRRLESMTQGRLVDELRNRAGDECEVQSLPDRQPAERPDSGDRHSTPHHADQKNGWPQ